MTRRRTWRRLRGAGIQRAMEAFVAGPDGLERMLAALQAEGFELHGPVVRDGAVVLGPIGADAALLPRGVRAEQAPGRYRLSSGDGGERFGFAAPAQSWKARFLPPRLDLVRIRRRPGTLEVRDARPPAPRIAAIGARPCDLAALLLQDQALELDDDYRARRASAFVLAVNCTRPGGTCFCASMGTGPGAGPGADLVATELPGRLVLRAATEAGARLLARAEAVPAAAADVAEERAALDAAAAAMGRSLDTAGLRERLLGALEEPRWEQIASRCLGCGACTLSCPTCFCTTVEDTTDLSGETALRTRTWDSCFAADFAYVHGGSVRSSLRARYRQWLTHKLATWFDQFGKGGCVGCGRCITWCPAGIDLTAEAKELGWKTSSAR